MRRLFITSALAATTFAAPAAQVKYMLWDSIQLPAYRQCAADFTAKYPGTTIKITQAGWDDYWTAISTGFIANAAPDVFVNHLGKAPQFVSNDLLVDLSPYVQRDQLDMTQYPAGLVQVWMRSGKQYGLPKDWDTVALMVNLAHAKKAGVSLDQLQAMAWNPKDGGSFETVLKRLTLDAQGRNALDPAFDKQHVAVYGYQNPGAGNMAGQTEWSHFAVSNGFSYQAAPWATPFRYNDPRLAETITWLASLPGKGVSAPYQFTQGQSASAAFAAGKVAMVPDGAWMIGYYAHNVKFANTWVPLPRGPSGRRASMLNGVADSIWVGSKVKEEAWAWVKYLASPDCQRVVAKHGVVFPAIHGLAEQVVAQHQRNGVDASAFLTMAKEQTFLSPVADNGAQVSELMKNAVENVLLGKKAAGPALQDANDKINRLFKPASSQSTN